MQDDTLDIHRAGELMNVHPQTVLDLINKCVIPAGKIGRAYVILKSDVMAYIENVIIQQTAERMGGGPLPKRKYRRAGLPPPIR